MMNSYTMSIIYIIIMMIMIKSFVIQQYSDYHVAEISTDKRDIVTDWTNRDTLMHNIYTAMDLHFWF